MARKSRKSNSMGGIFEALDMMLAGSHSVVGPDFILSRNEHLYDPYHADTGHIPPNELVNYDQEFVDKLTSIKATNEIAIPLDLLSLSKKYSSMRELIGQYQQNIYESLRIDDEDDFQAAKELKNFDPYIEKIVLRNDAETSVYVDYLSLYRIQNGKRKISILNSAKKNFVNESSQKIVEHYEKARFSLLKINKNYEQGAIKVTDLITQKEYLMFDKALNRSKKEGNYFICSTLNLDEFIMSSGGGVNIDGTSPGGKTILTLFKKHWDKIQKSKNIFDDDIVECVREIYSFCLRSGCMTHQTIN